MRSGLRFECGRSEKISVDFTTHTFHRQCLTMQVQPHRMLTEQAEQYIGAVTGRINSTPVLWIKSSANHEVSAYAGYDKWVRMEILVKVKNQQCLSAYQ